MAQLFSAGTAGSRLGLAERVPGGAGAPAQAGMNRWQTFRVTRADPGQAAVARVVIRSYRDPLEGAAMNPRVEELVRAASAALRREGRVNVADGLLARLNEPVGSLPVVLVAGEDKRGKSSLVNALAWQAEPVAGRRRRRHGGSHLLFVRSSRACCHPALRRGRRRGDGFRDGAQAGHHPRQPGQRSRDPLRTPRHPVALAAAHHPRRHPRRRRPAFGPRRADVAVVAVRRRVAVRLRVRGAVQGSRARVPPPGFGPHRHRRDRLHQDRLQPRMETDSR